MSKGKKENIRSNSSKWRYLLVLIPLGLFCYGLYGYFHEETFISHFFSLSLQNKTSSKGSATAYIEGQYKTVGEGFFVGKKINIYFILHLKDVKEYDKLKKLFQTPGFNYVLVKDSEDPSDTEKDISDLFKKGQGRASVNPGSVKAINFYDDKKQIAFEGDVVFKKEGEVISPFGLPIEPILDEHKLTIRGLNIAPQYVKYQVKLDKSAILVSIISVATATLAFIIGFLRRK